MLKNIVVLLCVTLFAFACSKAVKGPLSGKKFDVNVGGWSDMKKYKEARESVDKEEDSRDKSQECNVVDCPDDVSSGQSN